MNSHSNNNNHSNSLSGEYPINLVLKRREKTTGNFQQHWRKLTHKQEDRELNQCFFFFGCKASRFPTSPTVWPMGTNRRQVCFLQSSALLLWCIPHTDWFYLFSLTHFTYFTNLHWRLSCMFPHKLSDADDFLSFAFPSSLSPPLSPSFSLCFLNTHTDRGWNWSGVQWRTLISAIRWQWNNFDSGASLSCCGAGPRGTSWDFSNCFWHWKLFEVHKKKGFHIF